MKYAHLGKKYKPMSLMGKKNISKSKKGKKLTENHKKKLRKPKSISPKRFSNQGENHYEWKGNNVSYNGIHKWIQRKLGKPDTCKKCGKSKLKKHQIHWANISDEYKRDKNDWLRLCSGCHGKYDKNKRLNNKIKL